MRGVISVPKGIITGAFNIRLTFIRETELTAADIVVETIEGDTLGHTKDNFGGGGANYHILCYIPDARTGKSRISVVKAGLDVRPVIVEYDTVRTVTATWGTPIRRGSKLELPVSFGVPIQGLKKRNFRLSVPVPFQLYGTGDAYSVVLPERSLPFSVTISGAIRKMSGISAEIEKTTLDVEV